MFMRALMDRVEFDVGDDGGTTVTLVKHLRQPRSDVAVALSFRRDARDGGPSDASEASVPDRKRILIL